MKWAEIKAYLKHLFLGKEELDEEKPSGDLWKTISRPSFLFKACLALSFISLFFRNIVFATSFFILMLLFYIWNDILSGEWRSYNRCEPCWQQMKRERKTNWNKPWVVEAYKKAIDDGKLKSRNTIIYERIHNERCLEKIRSGGKQNGS